MTRSRHQGQGVLALDSSTDELSLAWSDGYRLVERRELGMRRHVESLVPLVYDMLQDVGVDPAHGPARILVGVGPGAFTGLRVGCAAAQTLGFAWGIPVVGIPTPAGWLASATPSQPQRVAVVTDARRRELFVTIAQQRPVDTGWELAAPAAAAAEVVWQRLRQHDVTAVVGQIAPPAELNLPFSTPESTLAAGILRAQGWADQVDPMPMYVREPDADDVPGVVTEPGPAVAHLFKKQDHDG